jgi:protein gp37
VLVIDGSTGYDVVPGFDWVIVGGESGHGARPMRLGLGASCHDRSHLLDA